MCEASTSSCASACALKLSFPNGKTLTAPSCILSETSPVLRNVLSLPLATPGVLELHDDDPEAWEDVLRVLVPKVFSPDLVNWDNVERMLVLADKYDMAYVRSLCCHFLSTHMSTGGLNQPLASAQNPLRATSLVYLYGSKAESPGVYRQAAMSALEGLLAQLFDNTSNCSTCDKMLYTTNRALCLRLSALVKDAQYPDLVVREVQTEVTCTLLKKF